MSAPEVSTHAPRTRPVPTSWADSRASAKHPSWATGRTASATAVRRSSQPRVPRVAAPTLRSTGARVLGACPRAGTTTSASLPAPPTVTSARTAPIQSAASCVIVCGDGRGREMAQAAEVNVVLFVCLSLCSSVHADALSTRLMCTRT
jgi:hypothetical protein